MPIVKILNRDYQIACGDGEEKKLIELAKKLDKRLQDNARIFRGANESMLIVMTALMLEDYVQDLEQGKPSDSADDKELDEITNRIDKLSNYVMNGE
jgi:cell division protein ZapA